MSLTLSRDDIRFLKIMYKIGNALAIIPVYNFEKCSIVAPTLNQIYASVLLLLEVFCIPWIIYLRFLGGDISFFTLSFKMLGTCESVILAMLKISLIFGICCCKQNQWMNLNKKFQSIDTKLQPRDQREKFFFQNVYLQFGFWNVLYFLSVFYSLGIRLWVKGISTLKLFLPMELSCYYSFFTQILICEIVLAFRSRYKHLNNELSTIRTIKNFKEIKKLWRLLGEMVSLFNEIFGLPLVFIVGRCIIRILVSLNFFISTLNIEDVTVKSHLAVATLCRTAVMLVATSVLILTCSSVTSESTKGILLCYELRERFPDDSEEKKELMELARIMEKHRAVFTAADFFEINRGTLFGMLGTTTTYLIVTLQINQSMDFV